MGWRVGVSAEVNVVGPACWKNCWRNAGRAVEASMVHRLEPPMDTHSVVPDGLSNGCNDSNLDGALDCAYSNPSPFDEERQQAICL